MSLRANSLESLSSPSPSPAPEAEPEEDKSKKSSRVAHLGSDSELSELTEEEQEAAESSSRSTNARRGQTTTNGRGSKHPRRGGRRKRSTLVPAPMWGWVGTKESDSEEQEAPSRVTKGDVKSSKRVPDDDEEQTEEDPPQTALAVTDATEVSPLDVLSSAAVVVETAAEHTKDDDETDAELGDDDEPDPSNNTTIRTSNNQTDSESDADDQPDVESELEVDVDMTAPPPEAIAPIVAAASASSIMGNPAAPLRASPSANSSRSNSPVVADGAVPEPEEADDEENGEDVEDDVPKTTTTTATRKPRATKGKSKARRKVRGRGKPKPSTIAIPDVTEGITATTVRDADKSLEDVDIDVEADELVVSADAERGEEAEAEEPEADVPAEPAAEEEEEMDVDVEEEEPEEPEDQEEREEREEQEDLEDDDEGLHEEDDEEELDLQPAHRIEALEVLASIELRFALVREKLYVEKMQSLAWEESLVEDGTHPELIYLQSELSRRKDKRLELAARKRTYEFSHVSRKRKLEEDATWSWWKACRLYLAKDELQTDMIAETNRKKRRLERDRRQMERPVPIRHIPGMPMEILTAPPTLRQLIDNPPFGSRELQQPRLKNKHRNREVHTNVNASSGKRDMGTNSAGALVPLAYPELPTLSSADVGNDLDYLLSLSSSRKSGGFLDMDISSVNALEVLAANSHHPCTL
uniref:Uncharacterized protein n=1 Tax=Moniliophthora roreri TaxID=221103 RepID=A0A0W0F0Y7_MONRR